MNYGRLLMGEKKLGGGRVFSLDISVLKKVHTEEYVHQNVLRLYQVGNTSPCKNTEVKQLWPWLALGSVTIQRLDVDAVVKNTVKSQKTSGAKKK